MSDNYILEGKKIIPCPDFFQWAKWLETADRIIAKDTIGDSYISTVFLGLDHSFSKGPPLLFETLVFGGKLDQEMDRYSTWDEAIDGHKAMIERVRNNK